MKLKKFCLARFLAKTALVSLLFAEVAHAQWILAARHVVGRINQITQEDSNGNTVSQFATVIIDAPAQKVYATAVNVASQNSAVTIISQDSQNLKLKASDAAGSASLSVIPLSDQSSEIMISSTPAAQSQGSSSSPVINSIMKICTQLNRECKLGAN